MYGTGTWDEGIKFCEVLHPDGTMIQEHSNKEAIKQMEESGKRNCLPSDNMT